MRHDTAARSLAYDNEAMHTSDDPKFAALIPVGEASLDPARVRDLVESILYYEPGITGILILDDSQTDRQIASGLHMPTNASVHTLVNPRHGLGFGYRGGLTAGILTSLHWIQRHWPVDFVLKIDADALMIRSLSRWWQRNPRNYAGAGLIGTVGLTCNPRFYSYRSELSMRSPLIDLMSSETLWQTLNELVAVPKPFTSRQELRRIQQHSFKRLRLHIIDALSHGFNSHHFCQGGAYLVTKLMMDRMETAGYFEAAQLWTHIPVNEDVTLGMYAYATGSTVCDASDAGKPFGIQWRGLAYPPDVLIARGYSFIHSIKNDLDMSESNIREYFASVRRETTTSLLSLDCKPSDSVVFYASEDATRAIYQSRKKIALYSGEFPFRSFSAMCQINGLIDYYLRKHINELVILLVPYSTLPTIAQLNSWTASTSTVVVYYSHVQLPVSTCDALKLTALPDLRRFDLFHSCGAGLTTTLTSRNDGTLDLILAQVEPLRYVMSGLCPSDHNVGDIANHIAHWSPTIVGCRTVEGSRLLAQRGVSRASQSGSDALDIFHSPPASRLTPHCQVKTFAFQASLDGSHMAASQEEGVDPTRWTEARRLLDSSLNVLAELKGWEPCFVNASCLTRDDLNDTWATLSRTEGRSLFQSYRGIELASYAINNQLESAAKAIRDAGVCFAVATSYHVCLYFLSLGIPVCHISLRTLSFRVLPYEGSDQPLRGGLRDFISSYEGDVHLEDRAAQADVALQLQRQTRSIWKKRLETINF